VRQVTRDQLASVLVEAHILPARTAPSFQDILTDDGNADHTPWYIQALQVAGAWLAALLFTVFFFGSLLPGVRSDAVYLVVGLMVCGACVWFMRVKPTVRFLLQSALALGIAGQIMFWYGIGEKTDEFFIAALAVAALNAGIIPMARQRLQTFLSVMIISGAVLGALWDLKWWSGINVLVLLLGLGTVLAWEASSWYVRNAWRPAGYGLVMSFLGVVHLSLYPASEIFRYHGQETKWWISTIGLLLLLVFLLLRIAGGLGWNWSRRPVILLLAGSCVLAAAAHSSPGILAALLVLALGYQRRDRLLSGLAVLFLAVFLSAYYYHLELTLLKKSAALSASGVILLLFAFVLKKIAPAGEDADA
jgi:uncharacterized membrane protein